MTANSALIRRVGKGYCAAGDGFYFFDEDLSRVLEWVAERGEKSDAPRDPEPRPEGEA
jgi:hypothetical protein